MNRNRLIPPAGTEGNVRYVMAKEVGDHVNLSTFDWLSESKHWRNANGKHRFLYSPEEMGEAKWVIMEEIPLDASPVWDCRDYFGQVLHPDLE